MSLMRFGAFDRKRKTKIIATIGPACYEEAKLKQVLEAGADVIRINASHTNRAELRASIKLIRKTAISAGKHVGIMVDLQGPRVRTGALKDRTPVLMVNGSETMIHVSSKPGDENKISTSCRQFPHMVKPRDRILIDNGLIELVVKRIEKNNVICRVLTGGLLGENKGINLPNAPATLKALEQKDIADLEVAAKLDADYIALSFVRSVDDIKSIKRWLHWYRKEIPVIAKIEKPMSLAQIDQILMESNALMVARGDLGIELGLEKVPAIQKSLIEKSVSAHKPVITATQMLESMIGQVRPTRAEVSDVANAVFDGTDAVMLSGETAIGKYPVESVRMMARIVEEAEAHQRRKFKDYERVELRQHTDAALYAISHAAFNAAVNIKTRAILVYTISGKTALYISKMNPPCAIIALVPDDRICARLSLMRGVYPVKIQHSLSTDDMIRKGDLSVLRSGFLKRGEPVVILSGKHALPGARFMAKIHYLGEH